MNWTTRFFLLIFLFLSTSVSLAQKSNLANKQSNDSSVIVYGFVRSYLYFDSRNTSTVCGGDYLLIPYDEDWNIREEDVPAVGSALPGDASLRYDRNATPMLRYQALSSRIGLALRGPKIFGAISSGRLEGDFAGFGTNNTLLRIRLAYLKLDWKRERLSHTLVAGQDWHPLCGNIMPEALGMAAGSPFRPHSRTPQLRYQLQINGFQITAATLFQNQFTSPGPQGEKALYANQSLLPELFLGFGYRSEHVYAQLGLDYTRLSVRDELNMSLPVTADSSINVGYLFKDYCHGLSPSFYFQFTKGLFSLKTRTTLAQNLGHLNMMSGYARVLSDDGDMSYKPLRAFASFVDLAYGRTWRLNLLAGYHKNLGLAEGYSIDGNSIYMKKGINNINSILRIAPSISYNTKAFNVGVEYEFTGVSYGALLNDGTVGDDASTKLHGVVNHRICLLVKYNF